MTSKPTILLVHGAWHTPSPHYTKLIKALESNGFDVVAPKLPTLNGANPPTASLPDDVACVRAEATALVESGRQVLVVCHSYGGIVATNALPAALARTGRKSAGSPGGIVALVYLCAFLPRLGESSSSLFAGTEPLIIPDIDDNGCMIPRNPIESFYAEVDAAEARALADALIVHPAQASMVETTHEAWRHFPMTYIFCERDVVVVPELQRRMLAAVQQAKGGEGVRTESMHAGHSPFVSHVEELVAILKRAWDGSADV